MKLRKKIVFILIIFLVTCALLEILLRVFKITYLRLENESIYPGVLGDYKPSQELESDYILKHFIKINAQGLRGPKVKVVKPKGVKRIMLLEDSYTTLLSPAIHSGEYLLSAPG